LSDKSTVAQREMQHNSEQTKQWKEQDQIVWKKRDEDK
jgi:hypothetical protein